MDEFEKDTDIEMEENQEFENFMEAEDVENTKRKTEKKKKRKLKKFAKYGLVFILICIIVAVYRLVGCNKLSVSDIHKFESGASGEICEYDGKVLMLGYDGVKIIGLDGSEDISMEYHMDNPHMGVCEDKILLYDKDDKKLAVYVADVKKYSYTSEQNIKSARINKNGEVVLITDESGYNYKVSVLNAEGKETYLWKIGDEYLVDVDISPDGKKLVAATITTETGHIVQNVVMIDVAKAKEIGRSTVEGAMPLRVKFTDRSSAVVISDDRICGYDTKAGVKWEETFENRLIDNYAIDEEGNSVVVLRGIKNNSVVRTYTKSGRNSGEYTTSTKVNNISLNGKYIAVSEYNKISLVDYSGKVIDDLEIKKEVLDIAVVSNNKVVVLCKDCIQLLRM